MQQKKVFGVPLFVTQMVTDRVNAENDLVILKLLDNMVKNAQQEDWREIYNVNLEWHRNKKNRISLYGNGCGCQVCQIMHRYVATKVSAHRLHRRLYDWDWCGPIYDDPSSVQQLQMLEKEWPKLRELSHQMREVAGI
jgi:hypothetical protein